MSYGSTTKIIAANRVKISRIAKEVVLTDDVTVNTSRIVDRINTRAGPVDTFRWRLVELTFEAILTKDLLAQVMTDSAISASGAMTYTAWNISGLSISGQSTDNVTQGLSAAVIDFDEMAPENGVAKTRVKLRISPAAT